MRKVLLVILLFNCFLVANSQERIDYSLCDSIGGFYIPKDLDDCIKQLELLQADSVKQQIKEMSYSHFTAGAHLGLGMWIRNYWGLWKNSRLFMYFKTQEEETGQKHIVPHPDSMSGKILSYYYLHLIHKDLDIDSILRKCDLDTCPGFDKNLFESSLIYFDDNNQKQFCYIKIIRRDDICYPNLPEDIKRRLTEEIFNYQINENQEVLNRIAKLVDKKTDEMAEILKTEYWLYTPDYNWTIVNKELYNKINNPNPEKRNELIKKAFNK